MKNRATKVHQVEAHESQPQMLSFRARGRGGYRRRGQDRMNNENEEMEYECFYYETSNHMSKECHMITCVQNEDPK